MIGRVVISLCLLLSVGSQASALNLSDQDCSVVNQIRPGASATGQEPWIKQSGKQLSEWTDADLSEYEALLWGCRQQAEMWKNSDDEFYRRMVGDFARSLRSSRDTAVKGAREIERHREQQRAAAAESARLRKVHREARAAEEAKEAKMAEEAAAAHRAREAEEAKWVAAERQRQLSVSNSPFSPQDAKAFEQMAPVIIQYLIAEECSRRNILFRSSEFEKVARFTEELSNATPVSPEGKALMWNILKGSMAGVTVKRSDCQSALTVLRTVVPGLGIGDGGAPF